MKRFVPFLSSDPVVAVIRLQGIIATGGAGRLNDAAVAPLIEKAFRRGRPRAVALMLNSPGGSPVQSSLIAGRIRRLADEKRVPVIAFVEDVAASGGYWLASAADEIFADATSIVGSIGVISAGFGFNEFIERHGVKRRVYTAGRSKSMLDPFRPEDPQDVARLRQLQDQIHDAFIAQVKARRGPRLSDDPGLFTGQVWVGERARAVGLIDGIGHMVPEMKRRFGDKVRFSGYRQRRPLLARLGMGVAEAALAGIEDRAAYARFGL
ncbi:peptidase, family S49 [Oceaniovalibus guishaninsula JLT2003]|uniref:Peptidase, family S49 n=1 Tax=Oceaniovalibus guishaninsula JLT2003 TaxID=1231392 RepID=K2H6T4_9RHOB|nr:S49 family peptidase [Oceaniovalibus guishaninsula]EKE43373.1 peptidase, family S49 [Oceaniovalibus guishaninsula JLT2003]